MRELNKAEINQVAGGIVVFSGGTTDIVVFGKTPQPAVAVPNIGQPGGAAQPNGNIASI